VLAYLKAEADHGRRRDGFHETAPGGPLREMVGRIRETDLDVPYREGKYFYYTRTEEGRSNRSIAGRGDR